MIMRGTSMFWSWFKPSLSWEVGDMCYRIYGAEYWRIMAPVAELVESLGRTAIFIWKQAYAASQDWYDEIERYVELSINFSPDCDW